MNPERRVRHPVPIPNRCPHKVVMPVVSSVEQSRSRCANPAFHWHRPESNVEAVYENPNDRVFADGLRDRLRYPADSRDKSVVRRPSPRTVPSTIGVARRVPRHIGEHNCESTRNQRTLESARIWLFPGSCSNSLKQMFEHELQELSRNDFKSRKTNSASHSLSRLDLPCFQECSTGQ